MTNRDTYFKNAKTIFNRDGDCTGIVCENCPAYKANMSCGQLWNGKKRAMIDWFRDYIKENDPSVVKNPIIGSQLGFDPTANVVGGQQNTALYPSELLKQTEGKPRLTLVPRKIITAIAKVREYGNNKYKTSDSWKLNTAEQYRDAAFRHWLAYLDDPDSLDEESGLPHLHHLATNIAFLIEGGFKGE
jgi:hypothetical protein